MQSSFLGFVFYFFAAEEHSSGNSKGLIRMSNNSVSPAMYKERKQLMSTSLDSIR